MKPLTARNPRTGTRDHDFEGWQADDVTDAAERLRAHQPAWWALGPEGRAAALRAWVADLRSDHEALLRALIADTGRTAIARQEVQAVLGTAERWAAAAPHLCQAESRPSTVFPDIRLDAQLMPYPLVGVISPWNFPLLLSLIDTLPALMAGCAVIVKPSEVTPRFARPLEDSLAARPELAGVLTIAPGDGGAGAAVCEVADAVAFTGSVPTGRRVAEACARRMIPTFLELGGKDPALVLESADVARAASAILRGACVGTGQACQSIERVYVAEPVADAFVAALVAAAEATPLAAPDPSAGIVGPLIFDRQAEIISGQLADAYAKGARALTGGEVREIGGALYLPPTVLVGVDHGMAVMTEETFGPIVPVMTVGDEDEMVRLANDSPFGLSAAVFGEEAEALRVAARLNVGGVSVNDAALTSMVFEAEKDSHGLSGLGRSRMGDSGLTRFLRRKAILVQRGQPLPLAAFAEGS
jgi:acyl-CoA reductase-like NAD-dependent aldehyde dehydrogenase